MTTHGLPRQSSSPSSIADLSKQCLDDSERWFPDISRSLAHHTLALAGEVGELANLVKKIDRGSKDIRDAEVRFDLVMEATDVLIYLLNIAALLGADLEKSYKIKRTENERRYGAAGKA